MRKSRLIFVRVFILYCVGMFFSSHAYAFYCSNGSQSVDWQATGGTITTAINSISLNKNITDIILTDMSTYAYCSGSPISGYEDALRTESITLSSELTKLGFSSYIKSFGGPAYVSPPNQVCIWPDANCTVSGSSEDVTKPILAQLGISRVAGAGNWHAGTTIAAGTEIARMVTQMRYYGAVWGRSFTWIFVLKNEMVVPAYTCSITQYDKNVTLPTVKRSDIVSHGTGRYPNAKKEFTFNLGCDPQTAVSVTFEGDTLSGTGTDSVLENKFTGNDNVGVQLLFNDSTPVKMSEKLQIVTSAQATQLLSFNAYYYYKGGAISGGPVKANATFTFDYQ